MTGEAAPSGVGTSFIGPDAGRRDVLVVPRDGDPLAGATATGFAVGDGCVPDPADGAPGTDGRACPDAPSAPDPFFLPANKSWTPQLTLAWDGAASLRVPLTEGARDVSGFGALTLRAATNWMDGRNPAGITQDFDVALVDADGREAPVPAAELSRALVPGAGSIVAHVILDGVRIPPERYDAIDLRRVAAIELRFGQRTPRGSIDLADVAFQETARPRPPAPPPPSQPARPAAPRPRATGPPRPRRCRSARPPRRPAAPRSRGRARPSPACRCAAAGCASAGGIARAGAPRPAAIPRRWCGCRSRSGAARAGGAGS